MKTLIIIKTIALLLLSTVMIAGFVTILKYFDTALKEDNYISILTSISTYIYITTSAYIEYKIKSKI
jgi:hypothetical protein